MRVRLQELTPPEVREAGLQLSEVEGVISMALRTGLSIRGTNWRRIWPVEFTVKLLSRALKAPPAAATMSKFWVTVEPLRTMWKTRWLGWV